MTFRGVTAGIAAIVLLSSGCGRLLGRSAVRPVTPPPGPVVVPDTTPIPKIPPESTSVLPPAPTFAPGDSVKTPRRDDKPAQRCLFDFENTPETRSQAIRDPISEKYTTYVGGGVVGICRSQSIRILADSAESYEQNRLHFLIGNVKYREDRVSLDADRVTYFQAEERLLAEGNVLVTMKDSSSMTGPRAEYFRAVRGLRPASKVVMNARPTLRMYETDSVGKRQPDPVVLIADNIIGEGDTLFIANGNVQMDRTDLKARSDSAILDNLRQFSRLMKGPVVESKGSQPFTLVGRVIDVFGRTKRVDRVLSVDSAKAVSKELTLTADTVDLRVADNKLNRAFAWGASRANAITKERLIIADSLDVLMPGQRLRELHAVRNAYAESEVDTLKIISTERDWLRGDTIVARFDSSATKDTTSQPTLRDLVAEGDARSFYQLPSNKGERERPGLSYVRGRRITVDFKEREVQTVTVVDSVAGVFLEATPPDTVEAPPKKGSKRPARRGAAAPTPIPRRPRQ